MRWLESAPRRYDSGMRIVTLGRVDALHRELVEAVAPVPGTAVLEIGCGTGSVTLPLVERGANVTALDQNPEMLALAVARLGERGATQPSQGSVTWLERSAAEIDALPEAGFDAVVASLSLSEMSSSERSFVLRAARARLRPGGLLAVADEVTPKGVARALLALVRLPQAALAWLVAGSLSSPIRDLAGEIERAGFRVRRQTRCLGGSLSLVIAEPVA